MFRLPLQLLLLLPFVAASDMMTTLLKSSNVPTIDFTVGFFEGFTDSFISDKEGLKKCFATEEKAVDKVHDIIEKFESGDRIKKAEAILELTILVEKDLKKVKEDCTDVQLAEDEQAKIDDFIEMTKDPKKLAKKLVLRFMTHTKEVQGHISKARESAKGGDLMQAGREIGDACEILALEEEDLTDFERLHRAILSMTGEDLADLAVGVVEGFAGTLVEDEKVFEKCFGDVEGVSGKLADAFEKIASGDKAQLVEGIAELVVVVSKDLTSVISDCEGVDLSDEDKKKIQDMKELTEDLSLLIATVKANIQKDPKALMDGLLEAEAKFAKKDYKGAGKGLGGVLESILERQQMGLALLGASNIQTKEVALLVKGLLEGFTEGVGFDLEGAEECVKDVAHVVEDLEECIRLTSDSMQEGVRCMAEEVLTVIPVVKECKAITVPVESLKEIVRMLGLLKHPWQFAYEAGKHLIINGREVLHDVSGAISAFKGRDMETFGEDVGKVLAILLVGLEETENVEKREVALVVKGLLEGFTEGIGFDLEGAEECVKDVADVVEDLEECIRLTSDSMREGLKCMAEEVLTVIPVVKECKAITVPVESLEAIVKMLGLLKHPWQFAYEAGKHLIINGREVLHDVSGAISAFKGRDMETFGEDVGKVLAILLVGLEDEALTSPHFTKRPWNTKPTVTDAALIAVGILEGFSEEVFHADYLEQCVEETEEVVVAIEDAVGEIAQGKAKHILNGIKMLAQVVTDLFSQKRMAECEKLKIPEDTMEKIKHSADLLKHPLQFAYEAGKHLIVNGREIIHETDAAVTAFDNHDMQETGKNIGKILEQVLVGYNTLLQIVGEAAPPFGPSAEATELKDKFALRGSSSLFA